MDSISFRDAYTDGVDKYYTLNGNTYRNPHESGVIKSLRSILDVLIPQTHPSPVRIFDLAAGSGEATLASLRFLETHRPHLRATAQVRACDPYTSALYAARTGLTACGPQSFKDILVDGLEGGEVDIVVCSFALHLCPKGELWGLLYALSCAARWLVVLAPGKGPEVGGDAGWERVGREVVVERVRGRVYRSLNFVEGAKGDGEGLVESHMENSSGEGERAS